MSIGWDVAELLRRIKELEDALRNAAFALQARSDRAARLEWAKAALSVLEKKTEP